MFFILFGVRVLVGGKSASHQFFFSMLDIRYIYLLHLKGTGKYKIGISNNPYQRRSRIDRDIPNRKVKLLFCRKVVFPRDVESRLHARFRHKNTPLANAGPSAGKTEWYILSKKDRVITIAVIFYWGLIHQLFQFTILISILDIVILILWR